MPLYRTLIRPGLLDRDGREAFSRDVVDVHCDVTGAPPSFVHAVFADDAGDLDDGQNAFVLGTIRSGRTGPQKQEIADRLTAALAEKAGVDPASIAVASVDVEASFTMEGGVVLPEPGSAEEEAWKVGGGPPA